MQLLSVNVSMPKDVRYRRRTVETGIFKVPVEGRVMLRTLNVDGDGSHFSLKQSRWMSL